MLMQNKFLPVGSVVKLSENAPKVMISGFMPKSLTSDVLYDYFGLPFPQGYEEDNKFVLFNHNQILEVCFLGSSNDGEFIKLNEYMNKEKNN